MPFSFENRNLFDMKQILAVFLLLFTQLMFGQLVSFEKSFEEGILSVDIKNTAYCDLFLYIIPKGDVPEAIEYKGDFVLAPGESFEDFLTADIEKLGVHKDSLRFIDYLNIKANLGNPNAVHDSNHQYLLPFPKGKTVRIMQGNFGKVTHFTKQSKYAFDFTLAIGDTITAARKGVVVRTESKYTEAGGKELRDKANQVVIAHDDGSIAYYVHLDTDGVLVKEGDIVEAGQPIGLSGYTGYTTSPHLHFVVRVGDESVPIKFKGYKASQVKTNKKVKRKD